MRSTTIVAASSAVALGAAALMGTTSQAANGNGAWAQLSEFSASAGSTSGTATIGAVGFSAPTARFETDAEDPSRGTSDFLNANTPPGKYFGSSQGERRLRVNLKNTNTSAASTTSLTFPDDIPVGHFAFVLGDIDVDQVQITAIGSSGVPLTAAELGFRSTFNFCNGVPFPIACEDKDWTTEPEWLPDEMTLKGSTPGNETEGASGWFMPTVQIKSMTLVFSKLPGGGSPTFRLWLVGDDATGPEPSPTEPSPTSPTPGPTPTPTPPNRPEIPLNVRTSDTTIPVNGTTTVVKSIKTKGRVTTRTVCRPAKASAAGEVRLCAHRFNRSKGQVTVRTFGRPTVVRVVVRSTPKGADRTDYRPSRKIFHFRTR